MFRFAVLLVTLAVTVSTVSVSAQQPTFKESVVVTATAAPESLLSVGRTLFVVTGEELRQLPISSVVDVLRLVSSVDVRSRGARGIQSDLSIRGAAFGQSLVLVNSVRLNDAQSGHHNSDLPVPLEEIERVEILLGSGSSLHGADATAGTVNVITRGGGRRLLVDLSAGQHGLVETSASIGGARAGIEHVFSGGFDRSGGFMPARDHQVALARYQGTFRRNTTATVGLIDKEFGANGFYGPAPSREWTDQLLTTVQHRETRGSRWQGSAEASYRTHGDHFIYDERNPGLSESRHRTHGVASTLRLHGTVSPRTQLNFAAGGGYDRITSTNLGEHAFSRGSLAAEVRQGLGPRVTLHPGLRVDTYSRFGTSWNPSVSVNGWTSDHVRLRASAGHAFRVPTFTELYYVDPNHQGAGALSPETAWSADVGVDLVGRSWTAAATFFTRWEDNVIDWIRPSSAVRWRTANIRDVDTQGIETSLQRRLNGGGQLRFQYTWLESDAPALGLLSKYVLDYARHSVAASGASELGGVRLGSRAEWKRRIDGRSYWTLDMQAARAIRRVELYAQVSNLFDESYQEIRGVDMPGRWLKLGLRLRR